MWGKKKKSEVARSCPILCDPMDCSLRGSSIHGTIQARVLEWVAIFFSRGCSLTQGLNPGLQNCSQMILRLSRKQGKEEGGKTWSLSSNEEVDQVRPCVVDIQELPESWWGPRVAPSVPQAAAHTSPSPGPCMDLRSLLSALHHPSSR